MKPILAKELNRWIYTDVSQDVLTGTCDKHYVSFLVKFNESEEGQTLKIQTTSDNKTIIGWSLDEVEKVLTDTSWVDALLKAAAATLSDTIYSREFILREEKGRFCYALTEKCKKQLHINDDLAVKAMFGETITAEPKATVPQTEKANSPAKMNIDLMILSGFIAAMGIAAVAIAFTMLSGTTLILTAVVGFAAVLSAVGLFSMEYKNSRASLNPAAPESPRPLCG